jgi:hypothetical protein
MSRIDGLVSVDLGADVVIAFVRRSKAIHCGDAK